MATTKKSVKEYGFIVRTGGGMREKTFGTLYTGKAEAGELSDEDKAEGFTAEPASNYRNARKLIAEYNQRAEWNNKKCVFTLVIVPFDSEEYHRLYKLFLYDVPFRGPLFD